MKRGSASEAGPKRPPIPHRTFRPQFRRKLSPFKVKSVRPAGGGLRAISHVLALLYRMGIYGDAASALYSLRNCKKFAFAALVLAV